MADYKTIEVVDITKTMKAIKLENGFDATKKILIQFLTDIGHTVKTVTLGKDHMFRTCFIVTLEHPFYGEATGTFYIPINAYVIYSDDETDFKFKVCPESEFAKHFLYVGESTT